MENTTRIANDQGIPRIPTTRIMEKIKFLNELVDIKAQLICGKEEINCLRALLNSTSKPLGSCALTMKDRMTTFPSYFTSYFKLSKKQLITIANEDHVPIKCPTPILSLHNVLHVPKLELTMGRTIGVAKEQGRLYYLQYTKIGNNTNKKDLPSNQRATSKTWVVSQIWLYHKHLRHLPFRLLKTMFPYLFTTEFVESFKLSTHVLNGISPIKHMLSFFPSSPLMLSLPSCVFWCVAFVHSHNPHHGKLDPRAIKCVFISYPSNKNGFKCYHPLSRQVFVSMDVTFHETQSFFVSPPLQGESYIEVEPVIELESMSEPVIESLSFPTQDVQAQEVTKPSLVPQQVQLSKLKVSILKNLIEDVTNDMPIALRKGKRSCVEYPISQFMCTDHLFIQHQSFIIVIDTIKKPTSV
ncbi:hypothetical protein CR513_21700, partial [Mucuna pruriens]